YELPDDEASYQHRSGRTGRAGKRGVGYTLATSRDENKLDSWEQVRMDEWVPASSFKAKVTSKTDQTNTFVTLHINGGRKDKLSPRDVVGAVIAEASLKADQIGKIEIQDRSSFVAVPEDVSQHVLAKL